MTYTTLVAINVLKHDIEPGDTITLTVRNEDSTQGMFAQVQRLSDMFLECYSFFPAEIAIHPDHVALIKNMGKSLDVTIKNAQIGELLGKLLDCTTLPTRIPLIGDTSLDLFTAVAHYSYSKEREQDFKMEAIEYVMKKLQEE
jgi:hypothetical protein